MSLGPIRPRFKMVIPGTVEEQMEHVVSTVARPESGCVSRVLAHHVDITVVQEDRHRWSPCLQLEFDQSGEETTIRGLVGPHPNVWTLFAFVNGTVVLVAAFGLMLGLVQLMMEQTAWGMWLVLGGVVALVAMYVISQIGQRCAAEQTRLLMQLVEDALGATAS